MRYAAAAPLAVALLAGAAAAAPVRVGCSNEWSEYPDAFLFDIDVAARTVRFVNSAPPRTVRAKVTARTIEWRSPFSPDAAYRLDRRGGTMLEHYRARGWIDGGMSCRRPDGKPLP